MGGLEPLLQRLPRVLKMVVQKYPEGTGDEIGESGFGIFFFQNLSLNMVLLSCIQFAL